MTEFDEVVQASFQIIAAAGNARSLFIKAIEEARAGNFEQAEALRKEAQESFAEAHKAHHGLIQKEAAGESTEVKLLLVHAEDQLMAAEQFAVLSEEFSEVYTRLNKQSEQIEHLLGNIQ